MPYSRRAVRKRIARQPTTEPVKGRWKGNDWIPSWDTCHDYYCERARTEDLQLVFLGDSLTWGWTQNKDVFEKHFGDLKAAQFGIVADTAQNLLYRLKHGELEHIKPRLFVILIGGNNIGKCSPQAIADGAGAGIKLIRKKLPKSRILLLSMLPMNKRPTRLRAKIKRTNACLARLADPLAVRYLDIHDSFLDSKGVQLAGLFQPDTCHLEKAGYERLARAVEPTIRGMLGLAIGPRK